jgi:hypothetical protein
MLLNEFLKEHRNVAEQQSTIADLKATVMQQLKHFESALAKQEEDHRAAAEPNRSSYCDCTKSERSGRP